MYCSLHRSTFFTFSINSLATYVNTISLLPPQICVITTYTTIFTTLSIHFISNDQSHSLNHFSSRRKVVVRLHLSLLRELLAWYPPLRWAYIQCYTSSEPLPSLPPSTCRSCRRWPGITAVAATVADDRIASRGRRIPRSLLPRADIPSQKREREKRRECRI